MLIPIEDVKKILDSNNIDVTGVFHVGAHECEELEAYKSLGIEPHNIVWIDAIPSKVERAMQLGIPNVYHAVVSDGDDQMVEFHVSNNGQSSSLLEFGTHAQEHPGIVYVDTLQQRTTTIDRFFQRTNFDPSTYSFWNLDIQGAELMALRGAMQSLSHVKALYLEVNEKELYKGCALLPEMDAYLSSYNFKRVLTSMTPHGWGDALYVLDR